VLEVVIDDPMTAADRRSKAPATRYYTWLDESLMSRVDGDGPIIVVAQRLDRDDIHARCLASGQHWCLLEPAAERDDRGLELRDHAGELVWRDDRAPGELIAPQMLTYEKLAGFRSRCASSSISSAPRRTPAAARSRATPGASTHRRGQPERTAADGCATPQTARRSTRRSDFDAFVISCDPTFGGTKTENDFCSIQVWGRARSLGRWGRYFCSRAGTNARSSSRSATRSKAMREPYPDATIVIENTAGGPGMKEDLEAEGIKNVEGEGTGGLGKAARLDNVSPTIEQGFAFLPIGMPDLQYFVDELAGMTVHDDDMDACSQAIRWLNVKRRVAPLRPQQWREVVTRRESLGQQRRHPRRGDRRARSAKRAACDR
jgi:phage terminase large subunit-like protein